MTNPLTQNCYTDNQILQLLATTLDQALAHGGYFLADGTTTFPVVQKDQPTQQGIPSDPTVYFEKILDVPYGFPLASSMYDASTNTFQESEIQLYETTVQVSSLVVQDPNNPTMPTASDVTNYMKLYIGSRWNARNWQKQGIGILRVMNVQNPAFEDDRHRFEYHPHFDFVITYKKSITFVVPVVSKVVPATVEGFGQGNFRV